MLAKINRIKSWQAAIVIVVLGFAAYFTGLANPFMGDDMSQIVNNVPVHSITHIKLFFEGGTFYNGQGLSPLTGVYYRPLMTTVFSVLYSLFGPHPFYFHLFQLMLYIGGVIVLYLFFRYTFKPLLALVLSLILLVHPIDSQIVYTIANLQDPLFFFFGILAMYLLFRFKSVRSLILVAACLFLSLLAKETAILFVFMALVYLFWFNRKRLLWFTGIMVIPTVLWIVLKIHAVGLNSNPRSGPIDGLSLAGRLFTAPSIMWFYIGKFIFPWKLESGYYWVYPKFSFVHFLIPLVPDLAVIALVAYLALIIYRKASKPRFYSFLFFAIWSAAGVALIIQIIPLDMTACETWFYFSMVGVLGMIGIVTSTLIPLLHIHINRRLVVVIVSILLALLCLRTAVRGTDYRSQLVFAKHDISQSSDDYIAYNDAAQILIAQGKYGEAEVYLKQSMKIYPTTSNYLNLGTVLTYQGNYPAAVTAFNNGLVYGKTGALYQNLARLTLVYGNPAADKLFLQEAIVMYPHDYILWSCLALFEDEHNDNTDAKVAIVNAEKYGQVPQNIYDYIMNNQAFYFNLAGKNIVIY